MPGSIDLKYAGDVAKYIGSNHHNVEISEQDFLDHHKVAPQNFVYDISSAFNENRKFSTISFDVNHLPFGG